MEMKPISDPSWVNQLRQKLSRLHEGIATWRPDGRSRLAVVGIGHELRGDDAAGVLVARRLIEMLVSRNSFAERGDGFILCSSEGLLIVNAGPAPENCTGLLRRFAPDFVLLVDAAQMGVASGEVRWLEWEEIPRSGVWTHSLSLRLLADYLMAELGCEVVLIGIQPVADAFGAPLSPEVQRAVELLAGELARTWSLSK
jgi:hydrogenase maturation protease HycI